MELVTNYSIENMTCKFNKDTEHMFSMDLSRSADLIKVKNLFFQLNVSSLQTVSTVFTDIFDCDINFNNLNNSRLKLFMGNQLICEQSLLFLINLSPVKYVKNSVILELPYAYFFNNFVMISFSGISTPLKLELHFENCKDILNISSNLSATFVDSKTRKILHDTDIISKYQYTESVYYDNAFNLTDLNIILNVNPHYKNHSVIGYFIEGDLDNLLNLELQYQVPKAKIQNLFSKDVIQYTQDDLSEENVYVQRFEYDNLMVIANSKNINKNLIYISLSENYDYKTFNKINMENNMVKCTKCLFKFSQSPKYINIHALHTSIAHDH
jgi:hypothetical protein